MSETTGDVDSLYSDVSQYAGKDKGTAKEITKTRVADFQKNEVFKMLGQRHLCAFQTTSKSGLPLIAGASLCAVLQRKWQKLTFVTETPMAFFYFKSISGMIRERRRQYESPYKYTIHPFSRFRVVWEFIMCIIIFIGLLAVPLNPALYKEVYEYHIEFKSDFVFLYIVMSLNCFNLIDMILWFFTGVPAPETKEVYLDPPTIVWRYMFSIYFITDLFCAIPFQFISHILPLSTNVQVLHALELCPLARIVRIGTMYKYSKRLSHIWNFDINYSRLILYLIMTLVIFHWIACLNVIIPQYFFGRDSSIMLAELSESDAEVMYTSSLYRSMAFLLAVAQVNGVDGIIYSKVTVPGDIILVIITIIIGYIICNLLFVLIVQITLSMKASQTKYQSIMNQLSNYMSHKQLPIHMQKRLLMFYEYRFQKTYFHECSIYGILSETLRSEINMHTFRSLIEKVPLLRDLPHNIIGEVVKHLTHEIFLPKDIIVKSYAPGDCMYFISHGTVAVFTPNGREVCHLQDGAFFGEIALVTRDARRVATVIAIEICELYRLDRKGFLSCYATNTPLLKKIEYIANCRMKKCNLLEELHKKYLIERTLRRNIDREDKTCDEQDADGQCKTKSKMRF